MEKVNQSWIGKLLTVTGLIDPEDMGFCSPHEHLNSVHQGPKVNVTNLIDPLEEMMLFYRCGGRTIVDMTLTDIGRNPQLIKEISEKSGVNIVMGTGFYKDAWMLPEGKELSIDQMAQIIVSEIVNGEKKTGIHAGIIGEVGVSRKITDAEERSLVASARAYRQTGAAINIHFDIGTTEAEYTHVIDLLENEGADLNRVTLDHFVCRPDDIGLCKKLTDRGCYIEFDLYGMTEVWPKIYFLAGKTSPEVQIASLKWFISAGMVERILIAQDVGTQSQLRSHGGFGYIHIIKNLIPRFKEFGITDEEIRIITEENPKRLFPLNIPIN